MDDNVVALGISSHRHSCKVCGKGFSCGRSLGGHMRSHSLAEVAMAAAAADDGGAVFDEEERGMRGAYNNNGVVLDSSSGYGLRENPKKTRRLSSGLDDDGAGDNDHRGELFSSSVGGDDYAYGDHEVEAAARDEQEEDHMVNPTDEAAVLMPAPRRRRRSMRVPAPAPPPAAAFDREPEDVALCLIMLSRDTPSRWVTLDGKRKKRRDGGDARNNNNNGYYYHHAAADSDDEDDVEVITKAKKRNPAPLLTGDEKRGGRYECPGCGRAFQSYQALGGHRASHKRINSSCSVTKVALDHQPEPSAETNASFSTASASPEVDRAAAVSARKTSIKFECPICFKVLGSGQALGGHKRSHSIAGELYDRASAGSVEPEQPLVAARFLDLNLPAPGAED
jgi:hypothetical protein